MIKKLYRLNETEIKKVLKYSKPFFSYNIVLNTNQNSLNINRFAIVIWWKSVINNVTRNYFRRLFYDFVFLIGENKSGINGKDFVFVIKKQFKLDKNDDNCINTFKNDLKFLFKKSI